MRQSATARQKLDVSGLNVKDYLDAEAIDAILKISPPGDTKLLAQVVEVFRDSADGVLVELRGLAQPHEIIIKTAALAHKLKASAKVAGARRVVRVAAELEDAAKEAQAAITVDYINAQCDDCEIELDIYSQLMTMHHLPESANP
ncbi:MAG: Hpt domain-containing protein [Pseudomonadota bacterium]